MAKAKGKRSAKRAKVKRRPRKAPLAANQLCSPAPPGLRKALKNLYPPLYPPGLREALKDLDARARQYWGRWPKIDPVLIDRAWAGGASGPKPAAAGASGPKPAADGASATVTKSTKEWLAEAWGRWPKKSHEKVLGHYAVRIHQQMQLEFEADKVDDVLDVETIRVRYYEHQKALRSMPPVK